MSNVSKHFLLFLYISDNIYKHFKYTPLYSSRVGLASFKCSVAKDFPSIQAGSRSLPLLILLRRQQQKKSLRGRELARWRGCVEDNYYHGRKNPTLKRKISIQMLPAVPPDPVNCHVTWWRESPRSCSVGSPLTPPPHLSADVLLSLDMWGKPIYICVSTSAKHNCWI